MTPEVADPSSYHQSVQTCKTLAEGDSGMNTVTPIEEGKSGVSRPGQASGSFLQVTSRKNERKTRPLLAH